MAKMVADGIIPSIVSLVLATDILTVHYACAALCRLCCNVDNAKLILDSGAVPNLVKGAQVGDVQTKIFCGAVLSSLSFYEASRVVLCDMGAITALKGLSEINDETTKQRVLVAFANLSCDVSVQEKMIDNGVVPIIAKLANSYQEINYICCAKAICNLACCGSKRYAVAAEGGVIALFMISMVQSVDRLTKLLCVLGLNNLLDKTTIKFMLEEGIIGSITNISKIGDNHISNLCAKIFNHLSKYPAARLKMGERPASLHALYSLSESKTAETQTIAIRTACNLALDPAVRDACVKAGVCAVLDRGASQSNRTSALQCLITIFSLCNAENSAHMEAIAATSFAINAIKKLTVTNLNEKGAKREYALIVKTVAMMSWNEGSRSSLQNRDFMESLFYLIDVNLHIEYGEWLAAAMRHLLIKYPQPEDLFDLKIVNTMIKLNTSCGGSSSVSRCLVESVRSLSTADGCVQQLACEGIFSIIASAAAILAAGEYGAQAEPVRYDIAALLFLFSSTSRGACMQFSAQVTAALTVIAASAKVCCCDLFLLQTYFNTFSLFLSALSWL
jgi:hypothetical protein